MNSSDSLTWQELPAWLLRPVMAGVLTLAEAAHLWDEYLMTPEGATRELRPVLHPVAERLQLWEMDCPPTLH